MRLRESKPLTGPPPVFLLLSGLVLAGFGGCSAPLLTFGPARETAPAEPASTGSIARPPTSFGRDLGEEDWRRAHAALGIALDPQGNGRPVKWDNPETGLSGSVDPSGLPYVLRDEICREFLARIAAPAGGRVMRGSACRVSGGVWELRRLRTVRNPARA